jgi:hypothetical protein
MAHGPDPHGDFVIAEEGSTGHVIAEEGTGHPTDDQGVDYPIGDEVTADTLQPAPPLRSRFGAQEHGK